MSAPILNAPGNEFLGGGVTPEQASLAQFNFGQRSMGAGRLGGAAGFGGSGLGHSTNETLSAAVGPAVGQAEQLSTTSDQLTAALSQFANAQQLQSKGISAQELGALAHFAGKAGRTT